MFHRVARLRHFIPALLLFTPRVQAKQDVLFTSSVSYCSPPYTLLVEQFDVAYFAANQSIWFNISAASVEPNVNVTANLVLNVYGMHLVNFTLDLCSLFNGALCPLPQYNFTGSDSLQLPASLGVSGRIPGIAYQIPDLEGYAQLQLTEVSTGNVEACVQATLSNGWSAHQEAVEWTTGGLALVTLISAIVQSASLDALAPYRLLDLLYLYQWIASTALLSLNYSSVYRAFATNFAWAMGLFSASASSPIQVSINNMRQLTGGQMANASPGSAVALVNRKLSPYNAIATPSLSGPSGLNLDSISSSNFTMANYMSPLSIQELSGFSTSAGQVQVVTPSSNNTLQAGVPIYVNSIGIATANAFMTIFLVTLMLLAIVLTVLGLGYAVLVLLHRRREGKDERVLEWKYRYPSFARAWGLRMCIIAFTPVTIFAFYQWTLQDSWLSVLLSVILFLFIVGYILYPVYLTARLAIRSTPYSLYTHTDHLTSHGPLYGQYRTQRYYFILPLLIATFLKALFIAFAQANGEVQVIAILIIEVGVLASTLVLRPHKTRGGDVLSTYLAIVRVVSTGLLIAFIESLNLAAIPRVAIGIVIAVIMSIAVVVMFFNTLVHLGVFRLLRFARKNRSLKQSTADESMLEKGGNGSYHSGESQAPLGRPINPTPEQNIILDPTINHPYPTTTPTHTTLSPPSEQSHDGSHDGSETTMGSLLPSRWSFQQSHSRHNSQSQRSMTPSSHLLSNPSSSPRQSVPPSPITPQSYSHSHSHSRAHSRQPTIEEYTATQS